MRRMLHRALTLRRPYSVATLSRSIDQEIQALQALRNTYATNKVASKHFEASMNAFMQCHQAQKHVYVTGIGKSGIVAQRFASALTSLSIRSHWVHGSEWVHGELGNLSPGDLVVMLSHSGNTPELRALPALCRQKGACTVAMVGQLESALAHDCDHLVFVPATDATDCPVPTRSIIAQDAMCNAILEYFMTSSDKRRQTFHQNHPGGAIGQRYDTEIP